MHRLTGLIAAIAGSTLAGCAHVTNVALCTDGDGHPVANCDYSPDPQAAYRFAPEKKKDRDTLVVVTFSGGGIRASALAYGTLKALAGLPGVHAGSLLDEVDVISSVSGGSVTAGWYALKGRDGIDPKKDGARFEDFLHADWTSTIAWRGLNPVALARYTFTPYQRSDMLSEFFSDKLFGDATYGDVLKRYNDSTQPQPFVILNATDLGHEIGFPFTQGRFDLLCSDLARYRLADAVTASANFPFAFSAIGIRNYSNCPVQNGQAWLDRGPPQWADYYDTFDRESSTPSSFQLSELRAARQAKHLVHPPPDDLTLHLLDGGLIDNLGIRSTLAMEDDPARVPGLYLRLGPKSRPDGYNKIRQVLYVVVNARTRDPASIDKKVYPPGVFTQNVQMLNTGVDSSILVDQDFLAADLEAISTRKSTKVFLSKRAHSDATNDVSDLPRPRVEVITVDFEMIPDPACREQYWKLGTNWGLPAADIDKLIELAQTTVRASSNLKGFYREATGSVPEVLAKSPSFASACAGLQ